MATTTTVTEAPASSRPAGTTPSGIPVPDGMNPEVLLVQRGRAELEFLDSAREALAPLRARVRERIESSPRVAEVWNSDESPEARDIVRLREATDEVLAGCPEHAVIGAALRWSRRTLTPRAVDAFTAQRDELLPMATAPAPEKIIDRVAERGGKSVPRYWRYEFHGTTGGWDGHEYMGFIHHELVYRYMLVPAYGDIFTQRAAVADAAPRDDYQAICDLGCGTGQYTLKLADRYPNAKITGVDLALAALQYAQRRAADRGLDWQLVRAPAEDTGLPAESQDLVTSFILLHEVPPHAIKKIFAEAFRLLRPGGDMVFSDVAPYHNRSAYLAFLDDWDAEHGNEPWWRTSATIDLAETAREVGFTDVHQKALGPNSYPWLTIARKPESARTAEAGQADSPQEGPNA